MSKIRDVIAEHEIESWSYGNGYTEPYESGTGCSCGLVYDDYMQHRCPKDCPCKDIEPVNVAEAHSRHLLGVLIRARMLHSTVEVAA